MKKKAMRSHTPLGDGELIEFIVRGLYGEDKPELCVRLLERFGSLKGVFSATEEELLKIDGMTERTSAFFRFANPAFRQAVVREMSLGKTESEADLVRMAVAAFAADEVRCDVCLLLKGGEPIHAERLNEKDRVRAVVGNACRFNANGVALLSYRPGAVSARIERDMLKDIADMLIPLRLMDIRFVDSITLGAYSFFGLRSGKEKAIVNASKERYGEDKVDAVIDKYIKSIDERKRSAFLWRDLS